MKKPIPPAVIIGLIVVAFAAVGGAYWSSSRVTPGPDPKDVANHSGVQSILWAKAHPPPGPPLPGGDHRRPK